MLVASDTRAVGFKSRHWQILKTIVYLFKLYRKDDNNEMRSEKGPSTISLVKSSNYEVFLAAKLFLFADKSWTQMMQNFHSLRNGKTLPT